MTFYYRVPLDYVFGTLSQPMAISATTATADCFTPLGTGYTSGTVVTFTPVVLHNPALGLHEVVWIVGHGAGSQQVTVLRGREGTTAQAWPSGTQVLCAPTAARDALGSAASGALPADAHIGTRNMEPDIGLTVELTELGGWQPSVGVAHPNDVGLNRSGNPPPVNAAMIMRAGYYSANTNGSGQIVIPFRTAFPNACHIAGVMAAGSQLGPYSVIAESPSGITVQVWTLTGFTTAAPAASGITVPLTYWAMGY